VAEPFKLLSLNQFRKLDSYSKQAYLEKLRAHLDEIIQSETRPTAHRLDGPPDPDN